MRTCAFRICLAAAAFGAVAPAAHGQGIAGQPVARADFALSTGTFSGDIDTFRTIDVGPRQFEPWVHMAILDVTAGYYWTDHLKTEIEAAWTATGEGSGNGTILLPAAQTGWVFYNSRYSAQQFGVGQLWQFGRNAMFHPWIGAGVDVVRIEHELDRPAQVIYVNPSSGGRTLPSVPVPALLVTSTTTRTLPFVSAGLKAYFNERGFVRSDLKVQIREGIEQAVWKIGVGLDF